eukprot:7991345-Pyramimonas_sp.AAC.1
MIAKTCVARPVAMAEDTGYEHKMAAMMERIKAKEKAKREQDDDNNTILGRTRHAVSEAADPHNGGNACTGTGTTTEYLAPSEPEVSQRSHVPGEAPCSTTSWRSPTRA